MGKAPGRPAASTGRPAGSLPPWRAAAASRCPRPN